MQPLLLSIIMYRAFTCILLSWWRCLAMWREGQIRQLDKEIKNLKERIQTCKQSVSGKVSPDNVEHLRPQEYSRKMPLGEAPGGAGGGGGGSGTCKWSEEEIEIALDVVRKNGKNYEALANSLDDKTVAQCRNFFTNYKRKLNLPRIIAEYETRTGRKHSRYVRGATDYINDDQGPLGDDQEEGMLPRMGRMGGGHDPQPKRIRLMCGSMMD
ncbi:REST corepressor 3 [Geodia barretti]|uniref:REST corepressor 3 n=1 Tax=Geodia barretti TaxID=519541 RepID=A0AA35SIB3_GEOBA|nr:REST corepressor 3 [Geodia barretti]